MNPSQQHTVAASGQSNVMVIFGDGRAAFHLVQSMGRTNDATQSVQKIIAVCDKSVLKNMKELKSRTIHVEGLDFNQIKDNNLKDLDHLIAENNVNWLVFIPFGDTFQATRGVAQALQAFKLRRGRNVLMISSMAADSNLSPSNQLHDVGVMLREQFPQSNCILRTHLQLQDLDYFSDELKQKKAWRLHTGQGAFAPVCLRDDVAACIMAIVKEPELPKSYGDQTFKLTNNENVTGQILAEMTKTAFRGDDVHFEDIGIDEARKIITHRKESAAASIVGKVKEMASHVVSGKPVEKMHRSLVSNCECELLLNKFQLIRDKKLELITDDVKNLTGKEPMSVQEYLKANEENFNPDVLKSKNVSSASASA